ncbi:MAG: hypothetical protein M1827_006259 [Pycnora praestabilis]|nr:MAG: hypothetical protein M1827_006259 [Pycnora praestabilis]
MPPNVYDDDSENEMNDELSPTDGYFRQREHPQDMLIPNPTTSMSSETKAQDALEDNEGTRMIERQQQITPRATQYTPQSSSPTYYDDSPLLQSPIPPPAYSAATSARQYIPNYNTTTEHERRNDARGVYNPPEPVEASSPFYRENFPQNMGGVRDTWETEDGLRKWKRNARRYCKLGAFSVLVLMLVILGLALGFTAHHLDSPQPGNEGEHEKNPKVPDNFEHVPNKPGPFCSSAMYHTKVTSNPFALTPESTFDFQQLAHAIPHASNRYHVQTKGEFHVKNVEGLDSGSITVDIWVSDPKLKVKYNFASPTSLWISSPTYSVASTDTNPCVSLLVTMAVPSGSTVSNVNIESTTLDVMFFSNLDLNVSDSAIISSTSGDVSFADLSGPTFLQSRRLIVHTTSGHISGEYPLQDLLSLKSTSGVIDVSVDPKRANGTQEAEFEACTTSGDIKTLFNTQHIPERIYQTHVGSTSGRVTGNYILGPITNFHTTNGDIVTTVLPLSTTAHHSLDTKSISGTTHITMLSPVENDDNNAMKFTRGSHSTTSGDISIRYPKEWEGGISGRTVSGDIKVTGRNIHVIEDKHGYGSHKFVGEKGDGGGAGQLRFGAISGSADVVIQ